MTTRLAVVLGTRPEAIKLAPLVQLARQQPGRFTVRVLHTGQHREIAERAFADFGLEVDVDLALMRSGQQPADVLGAALPALAREIAAAEPSWIVVQGDTTSTLAGALAGFYARVPVAHVEAGLRSGDVASPFPEEMSRRLVSQLSTLHFAPTASARERLIAEGIEPGRVELTGNTAIDALMSLLARDGGADRGADGEGNGPRLLVTMHRRENQGARTESVCDALLALLEIHPHAQALWPMHPSPAVRAVLLRRLGGRSRVRLVEPLGYCEFVHAMRWSTLILSDSGGVVEEAPSLGRPVLILRDTTERPEAVTSGHAVLVGTDAHAIIDEASRWIDGTRRRSRAPNPFGDGRASERILERLSRKEPPP